MCRAPLSCCDARDPLNHDTCLRLLLIAQSVHRLRACSTRCVPSLPRHGSHRRRHPSRLRRALPRRHISRLLRWITPVLTHATSCHRPVTHALPSPSVSHKETATPSPPPQPYRPIAHAIVSSSKSARPRRRPRRCLRHSLHSRHRPRHHQRAPLRTMPLIPTRRSSALLPPGS